MRLPNESGAETPHLVSAFPRPKVWRLEALSGQLLHVYEVKYLCCLGRTRQEHWNRSEAMNISDAVITRTRNKFQVSWGSSWLEFSMLLFGWGCRVLRCDFTVSFFFFFPSFFHPFSFIHTYSVPPWPFVSWHLSRALHGTSRQPHHLRATGLSDCVLSFPSSCPKLQCPPLCPPRCGPCLGLQPICPSQLAPARRSPRQHPGVHGLLLQGRHQQVGVLLQPRGLSHVEDSQPSSCKRFLTLCSSLCPRVETKQIEPNVLRPAVPFVAVYFCRRHVNGYITRLVVLLRGTVLDDSDVHGSYPSGYYSAI